MVFCISSRKLAVDYEVIGTPVISAHVTIESGTTITFQQNVGLDVDGGALTADAQGADTIMFTGIESIRGFWKGIVFQNSVSSDNVLRHVVVEYGGSSGWLGGDLPIANVFVRGPSNAALVLMNDVILRESGKYGLSVERGGRVVSCAGLVFEGNGDSNFISGQANDPEVCEGVEPG